MADQMSTLISTVWDQLSAFWYALPPDAKSTIIGSSIGAVATILTATFGAVIVIYQIGKQARHAIYQNRDNEAQKLSLDVYREIIGISLDASSARNALASFIREIHSSLRSARQWHDSNRDQLDERSYLQNILHPSPNLVTLRDKHSQLNSNNLRVIAITETWQIIDPRIEIFKTAISAALFDIDMAYQPYYVMVSDCGTNRIAIHRQHFALPETSVPSPPFSTSMVWDPPSSEVIDQIEIHGNALIANLMTLQWYIFDFQREMQSLLLKEMFHNSIQPRVPLDPKGRIITLEQHEALYRYFIHCTNWGRAQARTRNEGLSANQ
jgi:hypothetical protein